MSENQEIATPVSGEKGTWPRRILQVHNRYIWSPGGEISVLEAEAELLRANGHEVAQFFVDNSDDAVKGLANKVKTARNVVWSAENMERVRAAIREHRPDIVHVHNFFVHLSPSVYTACNREGVPVVQTLHNFRTCCAAANLLRDNRPCQDCVGKFPMPAIKHKCYRGSLASTLPLVAMQQVNRWNGSFTKRVDGYIVLSDFAREIFIRSGLPADKLFVKPNFATDHGISVKPREKKFAFVGRIVEEKGPDVIVDAWLKARPEGWTLHMLGEGNLREPLMAKSADCPSLVWHGWVQKDEVEEFVQTSRYVAMSSTCYEGFPLALAEALSFGTPAVVPDHGAMPEIMDTPEIGFDFAATQSDEMAKILLHAASLSEEEWDRRSHLARDRFLAQYTPEMNYKQLLEIYHHVREHAEKSGHVKRSVA